MRIRRLPTILSVTTQDTKFITKISTLFILQVTYAGSQFPTTKLSFLYIFPYEVSMPDTNFVLIGGITYLASLAIGRRKIPAECVSCRAQSGCAEPGNMVHSRSKISATPSNSSTKPKDMAARRNLFSSCQKRGGKIYHSEFH